MSDIRPITEQEMFDRVWTHFVIEEKPRSAETSGDLFACRYRSKDGSRCAVGLFILEHEYAINIEGFSIGVLLDSMPETKVLLGSLDSTFLDSMQAAHDGHPSEVWKCANKLVATGAQEDVEGRLRIVADTYYLRIPGG